MSDDYLLYRDLARDRLESESRYGYYNPPPRKDPSAMTVLSTVIALRGGI